MRRRISLYIADKLVELDEDSLILYNYTMEDLMNPTIVKNSYSQQITIPGTKGNNTLFGSIFRLDRIVGRSGGNIGVDYNPANKTPFVIYDEMNQILESGYCKLDSFTKQGSNVEYKVSLFGGLGSFLYSLAYDGEGNKRTLADLDYLGTDNPETELDFTINAQAVAEAWAASQSTFTNKWNVVNFAPAYNGIPEGNFSPDKAIAIPSSVGLTSPMTKDGTSYTVRNGYTLVTLAHAHDEWEVKDLRSYLQRPVVSMGAFLNAITKPENNGGYEVNLDSLSEDKFASYRNLWMTLPLIPSLGIISKQQSAITLSLSSSFTSSKAIARYNLSSVLPFGVDVTAKLNVNIEFRDPNEGNIPLRRYISQTQSGATYAKQAIFFIQALAIGTDDTVVGGSPVKSIYTFGNTAPSNMASRCAYTPRWQDGDSTFESSPLTGMDNLVPSEVGVYRLPKSLSFVVNTQDVDHYEINVTTYYMETEQVYGSPFIDTLTGGSTSAPTFFSSFTAPVAMNAARAAEVSPATLDYASADALRSNASITKRMLLSTSRTPADYLLSFCKMFGIRLVYDHVNKAVTLMDREQTFVDETIDLTKRVDLSKGISVRPFLFDSKWYDFKLESAGGAFMDEYKGIHGIDYGIQRVNTGYEFNAESKNLMDGNVFHNAATILARGRYFNRIPNSYTIRPSVFLDYGNKYTLWNQATGASADFDAPAIPYGATIVSFNTANPGYDYADAEKVELRTKDNKPVDGTDVLLFRDGSVNYPFFNLSDDLPAMDSLNEGVPCWIINPGTSTGVNVPIYRRYKIADDVITDSLDFGVPKELDIPSITYDASSTIYNLFWSNYMKDRYDQNTKVMTCRVDFGGLQVGYDLLRKFYWFDNSLWVLNAIKNYSLTTYDPVECEFVQVQDKSNYISE